MQQGERLFYIPLPENLIPANEQLDDIYAGDDVFVVGCPLGLFEEVHRSPLFRKGVLASFPRENNRPYFLIDVPTFEGASGSPVYIDSHYSFDRESGNYEFWNRFYFLGVVLRGLESEDDCEEGENKQRQDLHLGRVVRSDQLPALYNAILADNGNA